MNLDGSSKGNVVGWFDEHLGQTPTVGVVGMYAEESCEPRRRLAWRREERRRREEEDVTEKRKSADESASKIDSHSSVHLQSGVKFDHFGSKSPRATRSSQLPSFLFATTSGSSSMSRPLPFATSGARST